MAEKDLFYWLKKVQGFSDAFSIFVNLNDQRYIYGT